MILNRTRFLFLVILIEGYVVLASELLAIRLLIPFVGSGTEIISIIISAVLLPLAVGYHMGGRAFTKHFVKTSKSGKASRSVRRILQRNILLALAILTLSLSYMFLEVFFTQLDALGIHNRLAQTSIYCLFFLVTPVFILGQTVPLISHYFSQHKLSEITGRMLFFSTTGSFFGSVFSTIVLMTYAGVHITVIVTLMLLASLSFLLSRKIFSLPTLLCTLIIAVVITLNSGSAMQRMNIVADNAYNTVQIITMPEKSSKRMLLNRSVSSGISPDPKDRFPYIAYIEDHYIATLATAGGASRDILVLGAGGFTLGLHDVINKYVYVDIDAALKEVAEAHFLPGKLSTNKQFVAASARAFIHSDTKRYDLIVIDTYTNTSSIPMETTTREFLLDAKRLLKDKSILVANIISNPTFSDTFTVRYDNTFKSVFPTSSRQIIGFINPWESMAANKNYDTNVIYSFYNTHHTKDQTIYTDDKNSYSLDR